VKLFGLVAFLFTGKPPGATVPALDPYAAQARAEELLRAPHLAPAIYAICRAATANDDLAVLDGLVGRLVDWITPPGERSPNDLAAAERASWRAVRNLLMADPAADDLVARIEPLTRSHRA
jgi:hypothetical protein